jgi:hypothetical protein
MECSESSSEMIVFGVQDIDARTSTDTHEPSSYLTVHCTIEASVGVSYSVLLF